MFFCVNMIFGAVCRAVTLERGGHLRYIGLMLHVGGTGVAAQAPEVLRGQPFTIEEPRDAVNKVR